MKTSFGQIRRKREERWKSRATRASLLLGQLQARVWEAQKGLLRRDYFRLSLHSCLCLLFPASS